MGHKHSRMVEGERKGKKVAGRVFAVLAVCFCQLAFGQDSREILRQEKALMLRIDSLQAAQGILKGTLEAIKLKKIRALLLEAGLPTALPGNTVVHHSAMSLEYSEAHEQARWVAHIILPDVAEGVVSRTNDFRADSLIPTGSAVEADYFLKYLQADSSYRYDGFGYDRGHLAPSADFRWSAKALSESYLYSNMSPQIDSFNRGIWGDLEDKLREYVMLRPGTMLYVATGPVLSQELPRIERGVNKVAIPALYWKVALDREQNRAIAFIIPNKAGYQPLESYVVPVDSVERLTGLRFWPNLNAADRAQWTGKPDLAHWFAEIAGGDSEPIPVNQLKRGQINTVMAKQAIGSRYEVEVTGKVVGSRQSRAGNVLVFLDKQYPNEIFSVFIRKEDLPNFSYDPLKTLKGSRVSVKGKVSELGGKPVMFITRDKSVNIMPETEGE